MKVEVEEQGQGSGAGPSSSLPLQDVSNSDNGVNTRPSSRDPMDKIRKVSWKKVAKIEGNKHTWLCASLSLRAYERQAQSFSKSRFDLSLHIVSLEQDLELCTIWKQEQVCFNISTLSSFLPFIYLPSWHSGPPIHVYQSTCQHFDWKDIQTKVNKG